VANAAGGVNSNQLMDASPDSLERLAGMSHLNGVAVEVTATAAVEDADRAREASWERTGLL
jgi:formate dehydrogenase